MNNSMGEQEINKQINPTIPKLFMFFYFALNEFLTCLV